MTRRATGRPRLRVSQPESLALGGGRLGSGSGSETHWHCLGPWLGRDLKLRAVMLARRSCFG